MALLREKSILFTTGAMSMAAIIFMGLVSHQRSAIEGELTQWGFDRTIVISAESGQAETNGADARSLIANKPSAAEGPRAVLADESLARLAQMPGVAAIMAVGKSNGKLQLAGGLSADVTVFNVAPEFVNLFGLGNPKLLRQGEYIPSARLNERLRTGTQSTAATLGLPGEMVDALPAELRDSIDWSKAKYAIRLPAAAYELPRGAHIFDDALFTTGREPKFSIPGIFLIPSVTLFVRIRDDEDVAGAVKSMKEFAATAQPARPKTTLAVALLSDYFAEELGLNVLADWAQRLLLALAGISALLLTMLAFTLQARMRHECALRVAVGASARHAVWLSVRPTVSAISLGLGAGSAIGMLMVIAASRVHPASLAPVVACLIAIAMAANLLLMGITGYGARYQLLAQLNA
jgi:hypothetical protein